MPVELAERVNPAEYGWKAHYLGLLRESGYRTPRAIAYRFDEPIEDATLTSRAGDVFAVRSSARYEDSYEGSSAGSFLTRLRVPRVDVPSAAQEVRRSGNGEDMGVIVQDFIEPVLSGVAFSIDPTTYATDAWALSWVTGTGDTLVSGAVHGSDALLDKATGAPRYGHWQGDQLVLAEISQALSALAEIIHSPVDIEWCVDHDGTLWFLQARPIVLPEGGIVDLDTAEDFKGLPALVAGHHKISLRRKAAELGIPMTPCRVTIATTTANPREAEPCRSLRSAGSSIVLLHPFTVNRRVVREFAQVNTSDIHFFIKECRRYSIRDYPAFSGIAATKEQVASIGLANSAVAVVLEQEIWDADVTGIIKGSGDDGYFVEVGLGHFIPKGYVETSSYFVTADLQVKSRIEVEQSTAYHFFNGHIVREESPPGSARLSDCELRWIIKTLAPLVGSAPDLALEFGITERSTQGVVYLIDSAESDDVGIRLDRNALDRGVISEGRAAGPVVDLRRDGPSEDLHSHLHQSVVGTSPAGPAIFIAKSASVDLLPLLYACQPGSGFIFEQASLLAHFAVVMRERGVPGVVLPAGELEELSGIVELDTSIAPSVRKESH